MKSNPKSGPVGTPSGSNNTVTAGSVHFLDSSFSVWIKQSNPHHRDLVPERWKGELGNSLTSRYTYTVLVGYLWNGVIISTKNSGELVDGAFAFFPASYISTHFLVSHADCFVCIGIPSNKSAFNKQWSKCQSPWAKRDAGGVSFLFTHMCIPA